MACTNEQYLESSRLRKRLLLVYQKYNIPGEYEDFYQSYCIHILEGKGQSQTLDQYAIDFLRSKLGRNVDAKKALVGAVEFDDFMKSDLDYGENQVMCEQIVDRFKGSRRIILILRWKYGFSEKEIAYLFNVSDSRISQTFNELKKEFKCEYEGIY